MKEIFKNIYMGDVVLPHSPLKSLNSYIIKGKNRSLIIDTGFDAPETEAGFFGELEALGIEPGKADLYLTHLHADHTGLAAKFQQRYGGRVYCSAIDADYVNAMANADYFTTHQHSPEFLGLENDGHFFDMHPAVIYGPKEKVDFVIVKEGDIIKAGDYAFQVISLPGHTPDLTALYESTHKLLFSGDHILDKITPNISFWRFEFGDILGTYLDSLDKVAAMNVDLVFPSHRTLILHHRSRIAELKAHHQARLEDIIEILQKADTPLTVAQVAAQMRWDFRAKDFDAFPPAQKWFASGEAMAHLEHLRAKNIVTIVHHGEFEAVEFQLI